MNHIDEHTLNNHIENLEWISHKDNVRHAVKTGLCDEAHFENSVHVKAIYKDGREEIYKSVEDASKELDIARNSIRNSLRDKEDLNKDTYHKIKHCRFEKIDISYEDYLKYKNN